MGASRYQIKGYTAATATALIFILPAINTPALGRITETTEEGYCALGDASSIVVEAVAPKIYVRTNAEALSALILGAASRLVTQSKKLDPEFSALVDREFWNLL